MPIIIFNIAWMTYNIFLALIPVAFGWLLLRTKYTYLKLIAGIIWFLFLPNTIYISTDLIHMFEQLRKVNFGLKLFLPFQYTLLVVIGFVTFILAFYPIEKILRNVKIKHLREQATLVMIGLNFLIGFAMVLGRVERINSWDVITATDKVVEASLQVLQSFELTFLVILFGLFTNFFYFLFRDIVVRQFSWLVKRFREQNN